MITLFPARSSSDEPEGIGADVISSTSWLFSLFAPALLPVSVPSVTVDVT